MAPSGDSVDASGDPAARRERIVFVTGKLAEPALRRMAGQLGAALGFECTVVVLPITVAALMTVDWVARKLILDAPADRVVLPGWCQGDLNDLTSRFGVPFTRGPKDLHDLPDHFGTQPSPVTLDRYDVEILAEINHAPRLADAEIVRVALELHRDGANVIDLGCIPGSPWKRAGEITRMLRDEGLRVSIDSFNRNEVEESVAAGAELVLSCNQTNVDWAEHLNAELVVIPDDVNDFASLERTIERLDAAGARYRIDPILEPIGHGFARSLERFWTARRRWPGAPMMMGTGNVTELTEVDSAGVNVLLAGVCQELRIGSVLTTQVINWARSSVRELDLARRVMFYSFAEGILPKHVDSRLVLLRDPKIVEMPAEEIAEVAQRVTDPNFRIYIQGGMIHLLNRDGHWSDCDPFELIRRAMAESKTIDPAHAFYLGYELCKASTAINLGKRYVQDEALSWGFLTAPERHHPPRHAAGERRP